MLSQETVENNTNNILQEIDLSYPLKVCWKLENEKFLNKTVASDKNNYFYVAGGIIKSLNSETGEKRWETDLGGEIISTPYIDGENVYVVSKLKEEQNEEFTFNEVSTNYDVSTNYNEKNIIVRSLNTSSGVTIWQTNLKTDVNPEQIFLYIYKSTLLIVDENGNLYSICRDNGIFKWRKRLGAKLSALPYFYADKAVLGTFEKQLLIFNLSENETYIKIKKVKLDTIPTAISLINNEETLIIGDQIGIVSTIKVEKTDYGISKKKKKEKNDSWEFRLGGAVSNISVTPKGLLITSLDNFAYLISEKKGNLIWRKRLAGRISDKLLVLDNYALITTIARPIISVVELSAGKLINEIILEGEDFVTANPIKTQYKIIVPSSKGLYAFSSKDCHKIEK